MSMVGQIVKVTWCDAWFDFEPTNETFATEWPVETIGHCVREGEVVSIAGEKLGDGWRAVTHIPVALIRSIIPLVDGTLEVKRASAL